MRITGIILAAGQGKRMNTPVAKQFLMLKGKPVIYYSLKAFEKSSVDDIILVTGEEQIKDCQQIIQEYHLKKIKKIVTGGEERYDSVYRALLNTASSDYVLIHDGARPMITISLIERIIDRVKEYKACIIGVPVKETIKAVDGEGNITATLDRGGLWVAQTPQAFEYRAILQAYDRYYEEREFQHVYKTVTDDAMLYEAYIKNTVKMLMGDYNNLKLTTPQDLILAEALLA